ncbi:MAG: hypothetical protein ACOYL6_17435 [Bacteriovoracaceae bacterium]
MTFYVLLNQITTLFLSLNLLTTLSFNEEVTSYMYGGSKEEVFFELTNGQKTLVLKPKRKDMGSNLLVMTKRGKYYFDLKYDEINSHQFLEIRDGAINSSFKVKKETNDFALYEGTSSIMFVNKKANQVIVNGKTVQTKEYFSLGVPLLLGQERILN